MNDEHAEWLKSLQIGDVVVIYGNEDIYGDATCHGIYLVTAKTEDSYIVHNERYLIRTGVRQDCLGFFTINKPSVLMRNQYRCEQKSLIGQIQSLNLHHLDIATLRAILKAVEDSSH